MRRMIKVKEYNDGSAVINDGLSVNKNGDVVVGRNLEVDGKLCVTWEDISDQLTINETNWNVIHKHLKAVGDMIFIDLELECLATTTIVATVQSAYRPDANHTLSAQTGNTAGDEYIVQGGIRATANGNINNVGSSIAVGKFIHVSGFWML